MNRLVRAAAMLLAVVCFFPLAASAQNTYNIYVDTDGAATGCNVVLPGGTFTGADRRLQATATSGTSPQVTSVTFSLCTAGSFGPGAVVGGGYPVGLNNGVGGSDVIEMSASVAALFAGASSARIGVAAIGPNGSDILFTVNGTPTAAPFGTSVTYSIPMFGLGGMLLLGLVLLVAAKRAGRHRLTVRMLAVGLLLTSGIAIAANFVVDGQVGDWAGVAAAANDPAGDASDGSANLDLRAGFIATENGVTFFRLDVSDLQNQSPIATSQAVTTNEDTAVTITLASIDPENDPRTYAIVTQPTNGTLGALTQVPPAGATVQYTPNANFNGTDTFTFRVTDTQGAVSAPATVTITVTPVNDAPVLTAGGTLAYAENDAATAIDATITVSDIDSTNLASATAQITAGFVTAEDVLACGACGAIVPTFNAATGTLTLTGSATLAAYQAALRSVTYANSSNNPSTAARTVTWIGNDGGAVANTSAPVTSTINVTSSNDAPVLTAGATLAYTENGAAAAIDATITVTDSDSANLASATASITANFQNGADVLACGTCGAIVANYAATTGVLTLTGSATLAQYQAALRSVTYRNSSDNPTTTARTITWVGNDGTTNSAPVTSTVNITAVNDAPVLTAGATLVYNENQAATAIDATITVTDVDNTNLASATAAISAGFQTGQDVLACGACGAIVPAYNAGTGVLTLTGSATLAAYQAALRSVTYANTSDGPNGAPRTITWVGNDGTVNSAPVTSTVNVIPVNDAPVLTAGATAAFTENAAPLVIDNTVTVTDADNANLASATVSITTGFQNGADVLACGTCGAIVANYTPGTGVLTLNGSATLAAYQAALRTVTYRNNSDNPTAGARAITWVGNDGTTNSAPVTSTVNVTAVNDAPVLTAGATLNYNENQAPGAIDATVTVTDVDNANLASASVAISAGFQSGQDLLACGACGAIAANYTAATGVLTLTGSATLATYQAALRSVTYANTSDSPSTAPRTITWVGNDGTTGSAPVTSTVNVAAVNDAPVITAAATAAFTENGAAVTIDPTLTVTDGDSTNLASATITISAGTQPALDQLACLSCGGLSQSTVTGPGTLTLTLSGAATVATYQGALRSITFNNLGDNPGTSRTITWIANDGAIDSAPVTTTINVTAVNDAPVLTAGATATFTENSSSVVIDGTITVSDADNANLAGASAAITGGFQTGVDVLACTACGPIVPSYNGVTGTLTLTGPATLAAYQAALRSVTFANSSETPAGGPRTITWIGNDGTAASAPVTSTVNVIAINDTPVNTVPGTQAVADTATLTFPGNINVTDIDVGAATNFTTNVSVLAGTLTATASGATLVGNGTSTVQITGTITQVNGALNGLVYDPVNGTTSAQPLTVQSNDQGNSGGGAQTDTDTITINVDQAPTITATVPVNGAPAVDPSADLSVTFSESVNFAAGNFSVVCGANTFTFALAGNGTPVATINPTGNIDAGTTCTLTINGVGIIDTDTVDPVGAIEVGVTTIVTFTTAAIANPDNFYTATPNLTLTVPAAGAPNNVNVFSNDVISGGVVVTGYGPGPEPANCATVPPSATAATAAGGTVVMNATGDFVFSGAPGARTTDSFCYTITGGDTATVTTTFQGAQAIWFVDPVAAVGGNGTQARPFQNLGPGAGTFATATGDIAGDTVFVADGPGTCGVTLLNNQIVVGDGSSGTLGTIATGVVVVPGSTLPTFSGFDPVLTAPVGSCITIASGNTVRGLTIGNSANSDIISGAPFGLFTITEATLNGTGTALNLANGTLLATLDDLDVTSSTGAGVSLVTTAGSLTTLGAMMSIATTTTQGILVSNSTGNFNFGNVTITGGTDGVSLQNNAGGPRTFGTLSISGNSGVGILHAIGGGTTTVTGATTITNPGGNGIDIDANTTAVSFQGTTITKNVATAAVDVTASSGALTFTQLDITTTNAIGINVANSILRASAGSISATNRPAIVANGANWSSGGNTLFSSVTSTNSNGEGINLQNSTGTLTMNGGSITGNQNNQSAFRVNLGAGTAITYAGGITKTNAGHLVEVSGAGAGNVTLSGALSCTGTCGNGVVGGIRVANRTGGTIAFSNASKVVNTATNQAIVLDTNNGATIDFTNGGLNVDTTTANAFEVIGGGTVNVSGATNTIDATTGTAFRNSGTGGSAAIDSNAALTNTTGRLIDITNRVLAANVTLSGNLSNGGTGILMSGNTAGTITLSGATKALNTGTSNAVTLTTNAGATLAFTLGGLDIDTTSGSGFSATGGGTVTVGTGANPNTIDSTTGVALNVQNTTIGAGGLNFRSISSNGGTGNGIVLDTTGTTNGLTVSGNAGTCSSTAGSCTGGTIQNKSGADANNAQGIGIYLNNSGPVAIDRMQLNGFQNYAIRGTTVPGFALTNSRVTGANGTSVALDEGAIIFDALTGTSNFTNVLVTGGIEDNMRVRNASGTATDIVVTGSTFQNAPNDNLIFEPSGTANITTHITGNTFTGAGGDHLQVATTNSASSTTVFTGNFYSNGFAGSLLGGITISGGNAGSTETVRFNISNNGTAANPLVGSVQGGAININQGNGGGNWQGQVSNNVIGNPGTVNSGSAQSSGIRVENHSPSGTLTAIVSNNLVRQWNNGPAINTQAGDAGNASNAGVLNVTVTGNGATNPGALSQHGFVANIGAGSGAAPLATNVACADVRNNLLDGNAPNTGVGVRMRHREQSTVRIPSYLGTQYDIAAVAAFESVQNPGSTTNAATSNAGPGYSNTPGGTPCSQPTVPN